MQINLIVSHGRMLLNFLEEFSVPSYSVRLDVIEYEIIGVEVETLLHFLFFFALPRFWSFEFYRTGGDVDKLCKHL